MSLMEGQYNSGAAAPTLRTVQTDSTGILLATTTVTGAPTVDLTKIAGTAIDVNSGNKSAGSQRVVIATDDVNLSAIKTAVEIMDDWDASNRCNVNVALNAGVAVDIGAGNASTGSARVSIATDDVNLAAIKTAIEIIDDWDSSDNCKVDINAQTLTAIKVSKDANANATANRIFVASNVDQVGGTAVDVNAGSVSAGSQRVTIATDDINLAAIKTAVEILDDWDASDRCNVNVALNAGVSVDIGAGNASTGTARVSVATDDVNLAAIKTAVEIMDDWDSSDTCKVTLAAQTLTAVAVSKDSSANATANRIFTASNVDQVGGTAIDVNSGNKSNGSARVVIASDDVNLSAITTAVQLIDDAVSTEGSTAATKGLMLQGDDGTNARNLKMDSNGQAYVLLGATIAGEDVTNDRIKVQAASNLTYSPSKTTTTIDAAAHEVLASTDILQYKTVRLWVKNTHDTNAFTAFILYASPDGTSEHALDATAVTSAFGTLGTTTLNSYAIKGGGATVGDGVRYIRCVATANSDTGSCDVWLTGSVL